jgi:hypothetical protein
MNSDLTSLIYAVLKDTTIPLNYKRPNMSGLRYKGTDGRNYGYGIRSVTMGVVRDWKTDGTMISTFTTSNPELWELLCDYGKLITKIPFNSICINKNTIAEPHIDGNNAGISCIVGIGNYTGGELVVVDQYGHHNVIDIHNNPYEFDGSKLIHYSLPFEKDRFSIIYFK